MDCGRRMPFTNLTSLPTSHSIISSQLLAIPSVGRGLMKRVWVGRQTRSRPQRGMAVEEATDYQTKCLLILTNLQRALTRECVYQSRDAAGGGSLSADALVLSSHIPTRGLLTPVRAATLRLHCQQLHQPLSCLYYGGVNWFVWDIWHRPVICAEIKSYVCRQRSCMSAFTKIYNIHNVACCDLWDVFCPLYELGKVMVLLLRRVSIRA